MKLKKFNESSDLEPIDRSKIDPYNEEDWEDKKKDYSERKGESSRPDIFASRWRRYIETDKSGL